MAADNGPNFNWGLNADDLADQQANWVGQDSDREADNSDFEDNGDAEVSDQGLGNMYGNSTGGWGDSQ